MSVSSAGKPSEADSRLICAGDDVPAKGAGWKRLETLPRAMH